MTKEEKILWNCYLKDYSVKFYRQRVIDNCVVDFYCSKARLVIELDGSEHFKTKTIEKDKLRDDNLSKRGLKVLRISNNEINKNLNGVCLFIDKIVNERMGKGER